MRPGLYVGRTLVRNGELHNQKVRVINTTSKPQRLYNGFGLGNMSAVEVISPDGFGGAHLDSVGSATQCNAPRMIRLRRLVLRAMRQHQSITQSLIYRLPDDLTGHQRNQVVDLLDEYDSIFSRSPYDMGRTSLVEHTIDTGNHRPIRQGCADIL